MSKLPGGHDTQSLYVAARRVLLDALDALANHRSAVVLIGAQAVYVQAQSAGLGRAAYTSDGDLGIDPALLAKQPLLQEAMSRAGFVKRRDETTPENPGIWWKPADVDGQPLHIEVDLLVPEGLSAGGRRSAKIPPHASDAVLRVPGIEVAMENHAVHTLTALEPDDPRTVEVKVAGVPALLVAKAHKIQTRVDAAARGRPDRLSNKDASDVVGLMIASDPFEVADTFTALMKSPCVGPVTVEGLALLHRLFSAARSAGVEMAIQALQGVYDAGYVRDLTAGYLAVLPPGPDQNRP